MPPFVRRVGLVDVRPVRKERPVTFRKREAVDGWLYQSPMGQYEVAVSEQLVHTVKIAKESLLVDEALPCSPC